MADNKNLIRLVEDSLERKDKRIAHLEENAVHYRETIRKLEEELRVAKAAAVAMDSSWTPAPYVPPQLATALQEVVNEYHRAKAKHGEMTLDGAAITDVLRLACLMEEVGEVAHELTYDAADGHQGRLYGELLQIANVAVTWASALIGEAGPPEPVVAQGIIVGGPLTTVLPGVIACRACAEAAPEKCYWHRVDGFDDQQ